MFINSNQKSLVALVPNIGQSNHLMICDYKSITNATVPLSGGSLKSVRSHLEDKGGSLFQTGKTHIGLHSLYLTPFECLWTALNKCTK